MPVVPGLEAGIMTVGQERALWGIAIGCLLYLVYIKTCPREPMTTTIITGPPADGEMALM